MASNYKDGKFYNKEETTTNITFIEGIKLLLKNKDSSTKPNNPLPYYNKPSNNYFATKQESAITAQQQCVSTKANTQNTHTNAHLSKCTEEYNNNITRITWFGHSSILLEINNKTIFIDPMLTERASPVFFAGPKRFNEATANFNSLPELDAVLISHNHYDHLDKKTIQKIKHKVKVFVVPLGVSVYLTKWGVKAEKIVELDWHQSFKLNPLQITFAPARHFSGRSLFDRNKTLWGSFVIKGTKDNIFFSGDSGYSDSFKEIGKKYGPFDFAMIETGQYSNYWPASHMFPEQSVKAALDLKAKIAMPIHFASFALSFHSWNDPVERFYKSAKQNKLTIATPLIGQPVILGKKIPQEKWWQENTEEDKDSN